MTQDKGIFEPKEGFAGSSPFAAEGGSPASPFASPAPERSPFAVTAAVPKFSPPSGRPGEAGPKSPFGGGSGGPPPFNSPFQPPAAGQASSSSSSPPFSAPEEKASAGAVPPVAAGVVQGPAAAAVPEPVREAVPEPVREAVPEPVAEVEFESDSRSIRQLELRAIFGVDRELTEGEILQRARALPGIRQFAKVPEGDAGAVDGMRRVMSGLGFGPNVKLYCGNSPVEFVREGRVLLAVQTDGGFAPGVRETLMIMARELGKM